MNTYRIKEFMIQLYNFDGVATNIIDMKTQLPIGSISAMSALGGIVPVLCSAIYEYNRHSSSSFLRMQFTKYSQTICTSHG
mmetsp:Transcript_9790/g.13401  ORF Transcript_9790/g.13401 Transcript_9790/m.13401 type:complete len:81 (-) Transcript_9790:365-607(-)